MTDKQRCCYIYIFTNLLMIQYSGTKFEWMREKMYSGKGRRKREETPQYGRGEKKVFVAMAGKRPKGMRGIERRQGTMTIDDCSHIVSLVSFFQH